ncbi:MAG: tail fiber domain-containing protein [Ferruginibacter sp.]
MKKLILLTLILSSQTLLAQNVGIGTTSPQARLHVTDSSVLFSATGNLPVTPGNPPIEGVGRRMMWYADKAAFRAGYVNGMQWDKINIGNYSCAFGIDNIASGNYSTAMGYQTIASSPYSTSMGHFSLASGNYATAMGNQTTASGFSSTAMGYLSNATNQGSIAMGYNTNAQGVYSTAMGYGSIANHYGTSMGYNTNAIGYIATAIGNGSTAYSFSETAIGTYNTSYSPLSTSTWNAADRLFVIGNGIDAGQKNDALVVLKNGNIGIGTPTPGYPLNFAGLVGDKISLFGNSGNHYGLGIQSYLMQIYSDASNADIAFGYGSSSNFNENMRIRGNGNVGIGKNNPANRLHIVLGASGATPFSSIFTPLVVEGNSHTYINLISPEANETGILFGKPSHAASGGILYNNVGASNGFQFRVAGNITKLELFSTGNATLQGTLTQISDARLKKVIIPLQNSLQKITQLSGYNYFWKDESADQNLQTGVLAQEVQKIFPGLVNENKDGMLSVNYSGLIPVLIESIKEQQQQIDELKKLVKKLLR